MVGLGSHTPIDYLLTSFLRPMVLFELQPPRPNVSEITILRLCATEPLSGLLDLALGPEDPGNGADHQRVVFCFS